MKKPFLRVTKWMGNIPLEGICTSCPDVLFRPAWSHGKPDRVANEERMNRAFRSHFHEVHVHDHASQAQLES